VAAEAVTGVAVLVVTSLLVNAPPARSAVARPFTAQLSAEELTVDVSVDPARNGPADIHLYVLGATGAIEDVPEVRMDLTLPAADVGPLPVPLEEAGSGHFAAYGYDLPLAGTWTVRVTVRVDDFREVVATATMVVR
jgi:copper transport protein